ncbi:MAG TPA: adenosylcobinamide-GDP ribazoletransferase [Acidimicrobiales bacterium]|nr:adenosylcobinamide-GDP ribazoletransferase [Acidimicrobiales bacterium]
MSGARQAFAFLTPLGGAATPSPAAFGWFPVVGAGLGLAVGGVWWLAGRAWPAAVVAVLVVGADLGLTGLLHLDGLVDAADGLLPHLDRERRLEVMAAPDVGAFGVGVATIVVLARWASVASLRPAPLLLAGLWCASRTTMAVAARTQPYARGREGGLASAFLGPARAAPLVAGVLASFALAGAWRALAGPIAVLAGGVAGAGVVAFARHRLGGFTGDVLGAAGIVGETVGLLVAAAKW